MTEPQIPDRVRPETERVETDRSWEQLWPPLSYWSRAALVVLGVVIAVRILAALQNILLIVLAAFVVSLGLQPAIRWLESKGLRRGTAMAVLILAGLLVMAGAALAVVPVIVDQAAQALDRLPEIWANLRERSGLVGDLANRFDLGSGLPVDFDPVAFVGPVLLTLFNVITLLLLTPYFAVSFPSLKLAVFRLVARDHREDYVYMVNRAVDLTANYIIGNLIISLAAGLAAFIVFSAIGLPYAVALATWVGLMDLIPAIGALIGMIPALLVASQVGMREVVFAIIFFVLYQQFENYVIAPRVMRKAVNLNPALVVIALLVGGSLAGLVGALLALPVAALTKVLVTEFLVEGRLQTVREDAPEQNIARRRLRGFRGSRPLP
ncbi:MAG TPA: AI-2E family transporter [Acidimicrobiia bacterium]|nr:AI-2E family transporter [Acidimicrobiia bacterium]